MPLMISSQAVSSVISILIHTLAKICVFIAKPQDLPSSRRVLVGVIAAAIIVLYVCYSALPGERFVLPLSVAHVSAMGLFWLLLLKFHNRMERWHQSATAIYGCSSLINLAQLPLILQLAEQASGSLEKPLGSTAVLVMTMWFWEIAVVSSIIRQTLEVKRFTSVALSLTFTFAIHLVLIQLFGHVRQ